MAGAERHAGWLIVSAMAAPGSEVATVVQRFDVAWARADIDTLMLLVADDCVYDASVGAGPGTQYVGKSEVRRGFTEMLAYDRHGDSEGRLLMVDGARALVLWTVKHRTPAGAVVAIRGCDVFEVRDGLICRKDAFRKSFS
jgi:ketosteroid isomerase-like protein